MNVPDSSAWLAYLSDEATAEHFAGPIEDIEGLLVPVVCLYEVFRIKMRLQGEEAALAAMSMMQQGHVVDLDASLALEAASLGLQEKLGFADSVIYAVAQRYGATLWTQDEHFRDKPGVRYFPKPQAGT